MIEISLTEFVDFILKAGTPKLTVVKTVKKKHQDGYDPKTDFYKKLRDGIVRWHKDGKLKSELDLLATGVTDRNKQVAYPLLVAAYKKFLGRKNITWCGSQKDVWTFGDLVVSVNPELGLDIEGEKIAVKLYFKADPLTKARTATVHHMMQSVIKSATGVSTMAMLDVRNSKLIKAGEFDASLTPLLQGEAASFAEIYKRI